MEGSPWEEEDYVLISALEHYSYCPRQCALIHVEQSFAENTLTTRGRLTHGRVDSGETSGAVECRYYRGIPLWSDRLGLVGKADLVELGPNSAFPVEYKLGGPGYSHTHVQLCAQAFCLEEMLGLSVPRGAIFHYATRRREQVMFDEKLRDRTHEAIESVRYLLRYTHLPTPVNDSRCVNCSMGELCLPQLSGDRRRLGGLQAALFRPLPLGNGDA